MNCPTSGLPLQRGQHPAGEGLPSVPGGRRPPLPQKRLRQRISCHDEASKPRGPVISGLARQARKRRIAGTPSACRSVREGQFSDVVGAPAPALKQGSRSPRARRLRGTTRASVGLCRRHTDRFSSQQRHEWRARLHEHGQRRAVSHAVVGPADGPDDLGVVELFIVVERQGFGRLLIASRRRPANIGRPESSETSTSFQIVPSKALVEVGQQLSKLLLIEADDRMEHLGQEADEDVIRVAGEETGVVKTQSSSQS
jgi:hypothetical protein